MTRKENQIRPKKRGKKRPQNQKRRQTKQKRKTMSKKKNISPKKASTAKQKEEVAENENLSDSESDYSSSPSLELEAPEYIPHRTSLIKIFNINIAMNDYNEQKNNIKWGYTPHPDDEDENDFDGSSKRESVQSNISNLSPIHSFEEKTPNKIPKFVPSNSMHTILDNEDEQNEQNDDEKAENEDKFERVDKALGQYYQYFDRKDYFNGDGKGKFVVFCSEKKLLDESKLIQEFDQNDENGNNVINCPYLGFDSQFPLILTKQVQSDDGDKKKETEMR